jgi:hypothetical protein
MKIKEKYKMPNLKKTIFINLNSIQIIIKMSKPEEREIGELSPEEKEDGEISVKGFIGRKTRPSKSMLKKEDMEDMEEIKAHTESDFCNTIF